MEKDYKKIFAENLQDQLYLKKITRKQLSIIVGCSQNSITTWLNCEREITLTNLCRVAEALNCTPNDLILETPLRFKNKKH